MGGFVQNSGARELAQIGLPMVSVGTATALLLVVAAWAGISRRYWFVRAAAVVAGLVALYPIRGFEPMVWMAFAMPVTAWMSSLTRSHWARRQVDEATTSSASFAGESDASSAESHRVGHEATDRDRSNCRFGLLDAFLGMGLAAILSALVAGVWRESFQLDWRVGFLVAVATWTVLMQVQLLHSRGWAVIGWVLGCGLMMTVGGIWFVSATISAPNFSLLTSFTPMSPLFDGFCLVTALSAGSWIALWVLSQWKNRRRMIAWSARIVGVLSVAALLPLLVLYVRMARGPQPQTVNYGSANCYSTVKDLIGKAAGSNRNEITVGNLQVRGMTTAAAQLQQTMDEVLDALEGPGHVAFDPRHDATMQYYTAMMAEAQDTRSFARMLDNEAGGAIAVGKTDEGTRYALGNVRLGNVYARGGLLVHALVGIAIERTGTHQIAGERTSISSQQAAALIRDLESVVALREPVAVTIERDRVFSGRVYNWSGRLYLAVGWLCGIDFLGPTQVAIRQATLRRDATMSLLLTALAARLYQERHGQSPESWNQLVPEFLAAAPLDPYSGKPVILRVRDGKPVYYCVGPNGQDNGGTFGNFQELLSGAPVDLDLDIKTW